MKKRAVALFMVICVAFNMTGCRESDRVSYNISKEADNFNVIRRLTVLNARTDKPMYELIGAFSFELSNNRIVCTVETGPEEYKKHSIGLTDWTLWVVEDISGAEVSKYRYEVNILPKMIVPATVTSND